MSEERIDIFKYLYIFLRRFPVFLIFVIGIPGVTMFFTLRTTPVYEAKALLITEPIQYEYPFQTVNPWRSEIQILKTHNFAERVFKEIKQDTVFNKIISSSFQDNLTIPMLSRMISSHFDQNNYVLTIYAKSPSPHLAAELANVSASTFIKISEEIARTNAIELKKFLEEQIEFVEQNLNAAEDSVKVFKQKEKIAELSTKAAQLTEKLGTLDKILSQIDIEIQEKSALLANYKKKIEETGEFIQGELSLPSPAIVQNLYDKLLEIEAQKISLILQGLSENHPKMIELKEKIENIKKEMNTKLGEILSSRVYPNQPIKEMQENIQTISKLNTDLLGLEVKRNVIKRKIQETEGDLKGLPAKEAKLARLEREYKLNEEIFTMLKKKYEEAKLQEITQTSSFKFIEKATPPDFPVYPNKKQNLLISLVIGFGLALCVTLLLDYLDTTIKDLQDLKENFSLPVFASIPYIKSKKGTPIVSEQQKGSLFSEVYRTLRSNLKFAKVGGKINTLLITSAQQGEGKSSVAANLAITFSFTHAPVLVIEGDLRKPSLPKIFNMPSKPGLTEVLVGEIKIQDAIKPLPFNDRVHFLPPGEIPPNPTEVLSYKEYQSILQNLKEIYSFIILDSPPLSLFIDAAIMGSYVDGAIIVIQPEYTQKNLLKKAVEQLQLANTKILGVVVNKVKHSIIRGRDYSYSHYKYYEKYEKSEKERET